MNKTLSVAFSEAFSDFPGIFVFVTVGPSMENKTTARQVCSHQGVADSSLNSKTAQDTEKDPISNKQKQVRKKKNKQRKTGGVPQLMECLPSVHKVLGLGPSIS